ncbi:MAG TPA: iron dependent repressor, metal binding and dimerization domain protein [Gaiellaceae bacterium]|nr:iron dependent repressor, metal binding and dimerization domain protein [Gaiellaceae bacterium]
MSTSRVPILLPCHGGSAQGVRADDVAAALETSGLAELVGDIEAIVAAAREGREVIALDGCSASCQARLLDAREVKTLRTLNLTDGPQSGEEVARSSSVEELEAASGPVKRSRRAMMVLPGELSSRSTHSHEDYLLALDMLTSPVVECGALVDAPTFAAHVAHMLGVSRPAAGEMLGRLADAGYIRRGPHKDVLFTPEGRTAADAALRKQRILERFAFDTLGYGLDECYEQARGIAPSFTGDAPERVWAALGRPDRCPHGWPTDPERARQEARGLVSLAAAPPSTPVKVERVDETSRDRLRALLDSGVSPGGQLADVTVNEAAELVTFAGRGGRRSSISLALAGAVLVRAA